MGYDFSQLNDKEFEILAVDLISIVYQTRIERFKPGRDKGVDGRFFADNNKEVIVQCKHYLKTGYPGLIGKLKKEEAQKVNKLKPEKYIFVTSLPLSRDNKTEIKNIFRPYIKLENQIFGQEDLNDLLEANPNIVEKHFKLWISSTTVLRNIINHAIKGRSEFEIKRISRDSHKYVQTENHSKALSILKEKQVLIISGEPGIGKSTLAENLCLFFVSKEFEFVSIEESLSEAESSFEVGKKQIFYFDDFLGSNYFEAIENKKDSHIMTFIERIRQDKSKLLILTSRTNILNSGILHSSVFSNKKIQKNEFLITIQSLSLFDRARILYNHIWFSDLKQEFIDRFYEEKRYWEIIKHKNFNPRLIDFITDIDRITVTPDNYWNYILSTLDNPKDIWNDCFKNQNNAFVRNLVCLVVFNGGQISEAELQRSFNKLNRFEGLKNPSHTEKDFNSTARLATKSFLNRYQDSNGVYYSLFNPSVADYILNEYSSDVEKLSIIFRSLESIKSLDQLFSLEKEGIISLGNTQKISNAIFLDAFTPDKHYDYWIVISHLFRNDNNKKEQIIQFLKGFIKDASNVNEFSKLIALVRDYSNDLQINNYSFLTTSIDNRQPDESEIRDFAEFISDFEIDDPKILDVLRDDIEQYLRDDLDSSINELNLSKYASVYFGPYGEEDISFDEAAIEDKLMDIVDSSLEYFDSDLVNNLGLNVHQIVGEIDINKMIEDYIEAQSGGDYDDYEGGGSYNSNQDVDDLFERS